MEPYNTLTGNYQPASNPYLTGTYPGSYSFNNNSYNAPTATRVYPTPFIWVQGEAGAKAYNVAPGQTVILWDSDDSVIYVKSADVTGKPSMRVLDFTEREIQNGGENAQYATKDDLRDLEKRIAALINGGSTNG